MVDVLEHILFTMGHVLQDEEVTFAEVRDIGKTLVSIASTYHVPSGLGLDKSRYQANQLFQNESRICNDILDNLKKTTRRNKLKFSNAEDLVKDL